MANVWQMPPILKIRSALLQVIEHYFPAPSKVLLECRYEDAAAA